MSRLLRKNRPLPPPPSHFSAEERALWYEVARKERENTDRANASVTRIQGKRSYCPICKGPHVYKHGRK